jgi:hypothetical protein
MIYVPSLRKMLHVSVTYGYKQGYLFWLVSTITQESFLSVEPP